MHLAHFLTDFVQILRADSLSATVLNLFHGLYQQRQNKGRSGRLGPQGAAWDPSGAGRDPSGTAQGLLVTARDPSGTARDLS